METDTYADRIDAVLRTFNQSLVEAALTPLAVLRPGQVWRARWDDVFSFVFIDAILEGTKNLVRVAPVRIGTDEADDSAVILPQDSNPLSVALSIWPELVTEIAEVVLERWVTGVEGFESLASIEAAAESGVLRRGLPILNEASPRHRDRMLLELAMEVLSLAAEIPSGNGRLEAMLAGVAVGTVAGVLDVSTGVALKILRGEAFIDRSQAQRLAAVLERDPQELFEANPALPDDLIAALTTLKRSDDVRALARKQDTQESAALAAATRGSFALAARGEGQQRDWAGRVDRFFEVALSA
jgi:hypothetical protein